MRTRQRRECTGWGVARVHVWAVERKCAAASVELARRCGKGWRRGGQECAQDNGLPHDNCRPPSLTVSTPSRACAPWPPPRAPPLPPAPPCVAAAAAAWTTARPGGWDWGIVGKHMEVCGRLRHMELCVGGAGGSRQRHRATALPRFPVPCCCQQFFPFSGPPRVIPPCSLPVCHTPPPLCHPHLPLPDRQPRPKRT